MAIVDLVMPKMGESIMEATILHWNKEPGDHVDVDETVLEIATDKVDSEVPSNVEGTIKEILFEEDAVVPVGETIARIEVSGEMPISEEEEHMGALIDDEEDDNSENIVEEEDKQEEQSEEAANDSTDNSHFYSPLVLRIAGEEKVGLNELERIKGSGLGGRVTKKDILKYVSEKKTGKASAQSTESPKESEISKKEVGDITRERSVIAVGQDDYGPHVEVIQMDRMRKMIAEHMVQSKRISPHVTSFSEADVTNMVKWRSRVKNDFQKREGEKITFTPLFIEAIVKCIKRFPLVNSSIDGDRLIVKKDINIGMATALPNGSLIVPVIKRADQLNLVGLAHQVNELAENARSGKLAPDATRDGTFTITNVGTFGSLAGTPIINQPQVAILAVGVIKKRAVVVETAQGDSIAIRHMMHLSMSFDHRVVDGSLGATFLTAVANELEQFDLDREI